MPLVDYEYCSGSTQPQTFVHFHFQNQYKSPLQEKSINNIYFISLSNNRTLPTTTNIGKNSWNNIWLAQQPNHHELCGCFTKYFCGTTQTPSSLFYEARQTSITTWTF